MKSSRIIASVPFEYFLAATFAPRSATFSKFEGSFGPGASSPSNAIQTIVGPIVRGLMSRAS
jgi:hypothetical protein